MHIIGFRLFSRVASQYALRNQISSTKNPSSIIDTRSKRFYSNKQESYFSAIGGESDEPPPTLTPSQVTEILRANEMRISKSIKGVKIIDCNQLESNQPIEDRLRVSKFCLNALHSNFESDTLALAVFDGHGGGACADIISRRLFHYIAVGLLNDFSNFTGDNIEEVVKDLCFTPDPNNNSSLFYDTKAFELIKQATRASEKKYLLKYANDVQNKPNTSIVDIISESFKRCDEDLSEEIETSLSGRSSSNILTNFYLSSAVSGSCCMLMLIHQGKIYVASSGDCRAVLGLNDDPASKTTIKSFNILHDHNSDNLEEIKRLFASHPPDEQNNIIRSCRLLGQLMPLRAFGDFNYKWSIEKIKKTGLTRAFGSHVIPPYYYTPPYLIVDPDVTELDIKINDNTAMQKFIILATDGLWEQFENSRAVVKSVVTHCRKTNFNYNQISSDEEIKFEEGITLEKMHTALKNKTKNHRNSFDEIINENQPDEEYIDPNCTTYLIRTALGTHPNNDPHIDAYERLRQQHKRLVTFLTLPQVVVRNFRDDISVIVIHLQ